MPRRRLRLPDRNDALILIGALFIIAGVYQVMPWLALVIAGLFLGYVGIAADRQLERDSERE